MVERAALNFAARVLRSAPEFRMALISKTWASENFRGVLPLCLDGAWNEIRPFLTEFGNLEARVMVRLV